MTKTLRAALLTSALMAPGLAAATVSTASAVAQEGAACTPDGPIAYVCGVMNAEDIVQLGDSKWLIASSIAPIGGEVGPGRIYLIDAEAKTAVDLFSSDAPTLAHDAAMYPDCPGLDLASWDTHGLALKEKEAGVYRLYSTSHGALEAIQAFEVDARGDTPTATWVGCVPMPEGVFVNSVVILDDGGFRTTKFMDPTDPQAFPKIIAGEVNGEVYEWRPGGAVTAIAGTEASGSNGIEMSEDGRWLFVAEFGGRAVARYDLSADPIVKTTVAVEITPDNLRWTEEGTLLAAGGNVAPGTGWSAYEIDPEAMTAERIGGADQTAALQGVATAVKAGDTIWFGPYSGDRVGYMTAP